jgi:hypothetical protein
VVENPVEQNVTLQGRETAEEPVVAKPAHAVEEVVVDREATERTETVKDTVKTAS